MNASVDYIYIDPEFFDVYSNLKHCDVINEAIGRYKPIFFPPKLSIETPDRLDHTRILLSVIIIVESKKCNAYPQLRDDQSCT